MTDFWRISQGLEAVASFFASTSCYRGSKNILVVSIVMPKLKFGDVRRQVFFTDLVIAAHDAALEDRPEALDCVGMDYADDVFASRMFNDFMRVELLDVAIAGPFVGDKQADFFGNRIRHEFGEHIGANGINHPRHDIAATADRADNRRLAGTKAATSAPAAATVLVVGFAADESFVHFNDAAELVEILIDQRSANPVAHIPSRLIRTESHVAMDLPSAHALLAGQQEMNDAEPFPKIDLSVLEDCPGDVREPIAAGAAIRALPLEFHRLERIATIASTTRAYNAIRPAPGDKILVASLLVGEHRLELGDGHLRNLFRLLAAHNGSPYRQERMYHA